MTWAKRLKRVFRIDVETCDKCGGDVRIIASIEDPAGFAVAKGEVDLAYEYWVMGKGAESSEPRWSIGKDVLGWFE